MKEDEGAGGEVLIALLMAMIALMAICTLVEIMNG